MEKSRFLITEEALQVIIFEDMYQLKFNHPESTTAELEFYLIKEDLVNIKIWNTKGITLKEFEVEGHSGTNHIPIDWPEISSESIIFIQAATPRQREIIQYRC